MRLLIVRLLWISFALMAAAWAESRVRDDWKYIGHGVDLQARLVYSLQDVPINAKDKEQIYRILDDKTVHDSYTSEQRDEERRTVLSSQIGFIALAQNGGDQMIVRGPRKFCGASGNCTLYVYVHQHNGWHLALTTGGDTFIIEKSVSHGFHDLATYWHASAEEGGIAVYRWTGARYGQVDCYSVKFDLDHAGKPPSTTDCANRPGQR